MSFFRSPCKGCPERHPGCHAKCEWYREYRNNMEYIREERRKEKMVDDLSYGKRDNAKERWERNNHRK